MVQQAPPGEDQGLRSRSSTGHPVIGHRVLLLVVGLLSQRREDDAMANSSVGSVCYYTNSREVTWDN